MNEYRRTIGARFERLEEEIDAAMARAVDTQSRRLTRQIACLMDDLASRCHGHSVRFLCGNGSYFVVLETSRERVRNGARDRSVTLGDHMDGREERIQKRVFPEWDAITDTLCRLADAGIWPGDVKREGKRAPAVSVRDLCDPAYTSR